MKLFLFIFLSLFTINTLVFSQVTIGSGIPPKDGAILDLKENEPDANNTTSTKAFIVPRVFLSEDLSKLVIDDQSKSKEYEGAQVFNTNPKLSKALYLWDGSNWNNLIMSLRKQQDTEMAIFKQTGENDDIQGGGEIVSLRSSYTPKRNGQLYITGVFYAQLATSAGSDARTDLGNTFFKIIVKASNNDPEQTFIAATTPINAKSSPSGVASRNWYARNNPTSANSLSALKVKEGVTYTIRVVAQESWATKEQITVGTFKWGANYRAYSILKVDYVSDPY